MAEILTNAFCPKNILVIDTEGIFRRSGNISRINELKRKINEGAPVDMSSEDTHVVAGILKTFLRDLHEPLLTYELYDEIIQFLGKFHCCLLRKKIILIVAHCLIDCLTFLLNYLKDTLN